MDAVAEYASADDESRRALFGTARGPEPGADDTRLKKTLPAWSCLSAI